MTYCLGFLIEEGLVMIADTRTNAGMDNISTFRKLHVWARPNERVVALMAAGNLGVSQSVVHLLSAQIEGQGAEAPETLMTAASLFRTAQIVGATIREVWERDGPALEQQGGGFNATFLLGGQIKGERTRLFQIYQVGNFIEATVDTPFLQIGEHKYGKPILDRVCRFTTPLVDALKLGLVSMDSTLRSNLSVGLPVDILMYRHDALAPALQRRIDETDPYFADLRLRWSDALRQAYLAIPAPDWAEDR
jgi:putative proteasome-type protease